MSDELADAVERYARYAPDAPPPLGWGPATSFPRLSHVARTRHPSQWAAMMRAVVRLWDFPGDPADTIAVEASTYLMQEARRRRRR